MTSSNSSRDATLGRLADEFVERHRQGEHPPLSEYTSRHPELADDIRELFPALVQIEHLKPAAGDLTGAFGDAPSTGALPERLGEYRILREVGRGGMGVVYEAEQESLGRHVALKVLPSSALLNPTYRERFKREAKAAARLHHTNIVPVFGVGEADGVPYYAMQFIRGEGLDKVLADVRRMRQGPGAAAAGPSEGSLAHSLLTGQFAAPAPDAVAEAPPSQVTSGLTVSGPEAGYCRGVARLGVQIAEALAYAHRQGVLHRDVKPSNLLLDAQGTVWVTDFGLAKAEGSDELTGTGDIVGTLRFMAPERFDGRSLPQGDVYALGATLYELLTLRPAFEDANKARLIDKVLHESPASPRQYDAAIPRDLETVVHKCLAKAPEERYATAEELAEDLRRFLADRPIKARRASSAEKAWRWCRRNPVIAGLMAAVAVSLLLGTVVASLFAVRASQQRDKAEENWLDGRRKLFEAYLAEARANRFSGRTGQRFDTLARIGEAAKLARELNLPAERFAELRHVAVTALAMPDFAPRYLGETGEGWIHDLSDDLTRVLLGTPEVKAHVVHSVGNGKELFRLPTANPEYQAFFGPGGRHIVRQGGGDGQMVEVWRVDGPEPRLVKSDRFPYYSPSLTFRPDASALAMADYHGKVAVWDFTKGTEIKRLPAVGGEREPLVAIHPTQALVATCSYFTTRVLLRDFHTGATVASVAPPWGRGGARGSGSLVWRPDGQRLYVAAGDSTEVQEYLLDPATRQLREGRLLHTSWANGGNNIAINPAGDRLASRGWSTNPGLLDLDTGHPLFQQRAMKTLARFRFSADGRSVIGTYGSPRERRSYGVFSAGDAREVRTIPLGKHTGWQPPVVHPGGRLAVIPELDGFTFVDLAALRVVGKVKRAGRETYAHLAFDGEGRLYSNGFEGCFRWPVRLDGERLSVGPPERLPFQPGRESIAVSADGRTVAQAQYAGYGMARWAGGWLLTPGRPDDPFYLSAGSGIMHADVSRDGRLVCFGINSGRQQVFDARTGKRVWEGTSSGLGRQGRFTPDGRWLVSDNWAWRVGEWDTKVELDPSQTGTLHDISPDSRLALIGATDGYVRLLEIATGRELVRIEPPYAWVGTMKFTPDGTRLIQLSSEGLRVWELPRIRRELARYGLDWDAPPYPPGPDRPSPVPEPLQLTVHGGDLLSDPAKLAAYEQGLTAARLAKDHFDARGNLDMARRLIRENRIGEALRHLELARMTRPNAYAVRMNKALCLMQMGRLGRALADYTAATAARPEDYRPRYYRAQAYRALDRNAEAAEDLTAVLRHFPEDATLYEQRAACYAALGDKAREAADRAAAQRWEPRSAERLNERAWNLLKGPPASRDAKRALALIRKAIAIDPDEPMYHNTHGVALYRNERWTEAIAALTKSLARTKSEHAAWDLYFLAMCHAQTGEPGKAKECFDRAVKSAAAAKGLSPREVEELTAFHKEAEEVLRRE